MVHLCRGTSYCCVDWHGTLMSFNIVPLCPLTWYRFVVGHGTVVSIDTVPLCRWTWYPRVVWHGSIVSIYMVALCRWTWYYCVNWHGTILSRDMVPFSHNFSKCLVSFVHLWCGGSIRQLNCLLIPFLVQPHAHPRKIFPVLYSLCLIHFLCFYAQRILRIKHAYLMKQCVVLGDLQLLFLRGPPEQVHFPMPVTWRRKQSGFTKRYVPIVC
jgi:hypothetical protein